MSQVTHIHSGMRIVGSIIGAGDVVIAGHVQGPVQTADAVTVEAGGIVEGDVIGQKVLVRGVVVGVTAAVELLEVTANGQMVGDIRTRRVQLRAGGRISGQVSTGVDVKPFQASVSVARGPLSPRSLTGSTRLGHSPTRLVPSASPQPSSPLVASARPSASSFSSAPPRPGSGGLHASAGGDIVEDDASPAAEIVETTPAPTSAPAVAGDSSEPIKRVNRDAVETS